MINNFPIPKKNVYLIIIGFIFMVIGYALMTGGGSSDPQLFFEEELFSFRRITLAPIIIILGMVIEIIAIMYVPKSKEK